MNDNNEVITEIKLHMLKWVEKVERITEQEDMYGLRRAVENLHYHFHGMSFDDLLTSEGPIYLRHCISASV